MKNKFVSPFNCNLDVSSSAIFLSVLQLFRSSWKLISEIANNIGLLLLNLTISWFSLADYEVLIKYVIKILY